MCHPSPSRLGRTEKGSQYKRRGIEFFFLEKVKKQKENIWLIQFEFQFGQLFANLDRLVVSENICETFLPVGELQLLR